MGDVKRHYHEHERLVAVALGQPAVRLVVIQAWHSPADGQHAEESGHAIYPVLAIRSTVRARFHASNFSPLPPAAGGTLRSLSENGWHRQDDRLDDEPLVISAEFDCLSTIDEIHCPNTAERLLACPWPPERDGEMAAPIVARMLAEMKERRQAPAT